MSYPSWQKRCGELNGYDHEAQSSCHVPLRELETELELAEGHVSDWLYESAAYADCLTKQAFNSNRGHSYRSYRVTVRKAKKPANNNGRNS